MGRRYAVWSVRWASNDRQKFISRPFRRSARSGQRATSVTQGTQNLPHTLSTTFTREIPRVTAIAHPYSQPALSQGVAEALQLDGTLQHSAALQLYSALALYRLYSSTSSTWYNIPQTIMEPKACVAGSGSRKGSRPRGHAADGSGSGAGPESLARSARALSRASENFRKAVRATRASHGFA